MLRVNQQDIKKSLLTVELKSSWVTEVGMKCTLGDNLRTRKKILSKKWHNYC